VTIIIKICHDCERGNLWREKPTGVGRGKEEEMGCEYNGSLLYKYEKSIMKPLTTL
jgi:hypothetical protein